VRFASAIAAGSEGAAAGAAEETEDTVAEPDVTAVAEGAAIGPEALAAGAVAFFAVAFFTAADADGGGAGGTSSAGRFAGADEMMGTIDAEGGAAAEGTVDELEAEEGAGGGC